VVAEATAAAVVVTEEEAHPLLLVAVHPLLQVEGAEVEVGVVPQLLRPLVEAVMVVGAVKAAAVCWAFRAEAADPLLLLQVEAAEAAEHPLRHQHPLLLPRAVHPLPLVVAEAAVVVTVVVKGVAVSSVVVAAPQLLRPLPLGAVTAVASVAMVVAAVTVVAVTVVVKETASVALLRLLRSLRAEAEEHPLRHQHPLLLLRFSKNNNLPPKRPSR
jgi:hypothetical protein